MSCLDVEGSLRLAELDRQYRQRLQKFFRSRGCSAAVAQDLVQDVFVRVIAYQRSRQIANAKTFVFQTAANLLRDKARSMKRWHVAPLDDAYTTSASDVQLIDLITPERIVEGREDVRVVRAALEELDARTQRIFLMNRIEHLRHRTIADRLGLSVSLIEKSLRGARRHLDGSWREACA